MFSWYSVIINMNVLRVRYGADTIKTTHYHSRDGRHFYFGFQNAKLTYSQFASNPARIWQTSQSLPVTS